MKQERSIIKLKWYNVFAIFIDAYHTQIKDEENKIKKAVIYSIISIDLTGKKELCGFYSFFGSESKEDWLVIFNDLISRGLKRLLLIVSDDFSGLKEAITALFPKAKHHFVLFICKEISKEIWAKKMLKTLMKNCH